MVNGAGDRDPLALAPGEEQSRLADAGLIRKREPLDELVRVRHASGPGDALHVRLVIAEGEVAGDRVVEEVVLLEHETDVSSQRAVVEPSPEYPDTLFNLNMGLKRWVYRVSGYAMLMTDDYPPFRLDIGGTEGEAPTLGPIGPQPIPG